MSKRVVVAVGLTIACVVVGSYLAWTRHREHQAALAYCGEAEFARWEAEYVPAARDFDLVADVAAVTPRVSLAPMLLRMSEAVAKAEAVRPVPCAATGIQNLTVSMEMRIAAFRDFAASSDINGISVVFSAANDVREQARSEIAAARAKMVK